MAIPPVNLLSNLVGGAIPNVLDAQNKFANNRHIARYNKTKADYAGLTIPAESYSKIAYANAVAPQILAKLMGNEGALANMSEAQKKNMLAAIQNAGFKSNQGMGGNSLNQSPEEQTYTGVGQPSTNSHSNFFMNGLKHALSGIGDLFGQNNNQQNGNALNQLIPQQKVMQSAGQNQEPDNLDHEYDAFIQNWLKSPEGQQEMNSSENPHIPSPEEFHAMKSNNQAAQREPTYAENAGAYKGIVKAGEEQGKYNAEDIHNIGVDQQNIAKSGAVLDRLTNIVKSEEFQNMRKEIPDFQAAQLGYLSKHGTPEQQQVIGDFLSSAEAYKAATVNSFAGKPLVREFDLANKIKIGEDDTTATAEGKLRSLTALKKIAEEKNDIVLTLMNTKHMNIGDATKEANHMVDIKGIEDQVNKSLERHVSVTNKKTGQKEYISLSEARKRGVPNV